MERYYTKSARNLAFAEIRFPAAGRKSSVYPAKRPSIILHEILHFSKKSCQTGPKRGDAGLIRTKAIFRALAPRKRLETAKNPGTD
ncbi:hypothetical protein [Candidatus Allofournierella excrementavium]|uniref:hypothetical protein n=1 Tax=Candidatus Allofournierella excrementavium TaxID=2838591 RepID=UPI003AF76270